MQSAVLKLSSLSIFLLFSAVRGQFEGPPETLTAKIGVLLVEPFVKFKPDCQGPEIPSHCKGADGLEGFLVDLVKILADRVGFSFSLELNALNRYGTREPNGSWNGLIGEVLRGEVDFALAPMAVTEERRREVDFSVPYMHAGISIMVKKAQKRMPNPYLLLAPFDRNTWTVIGAVGVGLIALYWLLARIAQSSLKQNEKLGGLWLLKLVPLLFVAVVFAVYTASLSHLLSHQFRPPPMITSLEDLIQHPTIRFGIQRGGSTAAFFRNSSDPMIARMWATMQTAIPSVFVSNYAEGISRVRLDPEGFAFLLESPANAYANSRKPCDTMRVGGVLNSIAYSIPTAKRSPWKKRLDFALETLKTEGEIAKLQKRWWVDRGQCGGGTLTIVDGSLGLDQMAVLVWLTIAAALVAVVLGALGSPIARRISWPSRKATLQLQNHQNGELEKMCQNDQS